jgi:hypothetical protein
MFDRFGKKFGRRNRRASSQVVVPQAAGTMVVAERSGISFQTFR